MITALLALSAWSTLCGTAVAREVSAPFLVQVLLLVGTFVAARASSAAPRWLAVATSVPFVLAVTLQEGIALRDRVLADLVALLVVGGLAWLIARRAQRDRPVAAPGLAAR